MPTRFVQRGGLWGSLGENFWNASCINITFPLQIIRGTGSLLWIFNILLSCAWCNTVKTVSISIQADLLMKANTFMDLPTGTSNMKSGVLS